MTLTKKPSTVKTHWEIAKKWESAGADMIHLVDLDATLGRGSNFDSLKNIAESVKIPVQVAGGLRNEKIIEEALKFATRVVIGTLAFKDKTALDRLLATYGSEKLVISVDHNDGKIVTNGWKETTSLELVSMVKELVKNGFTEFLSTSINRDGTLQGPDVKWLSSLSGKFFQINNVNVIASGGISNIGDVMSVKKLNPFWSNIGVKHSMKIKSQLRRQK